MGVTNVDVLECNSINLGTKSNHIADANAAHTINATFSNTEVKTALDALGGKINAILKVLEDNHIVKKS